MKYIIAIIGLLFVLDAPIIYAQHGKYWVFFDNKDTEPGAYHISRQTMVNRELLNLPLYQFTDIPVKAEYKKKIGNVCQILHESKWLNAISVIATNPQIQTIKRFSFVTGVAEISNRSFLAGNYENVSTLNHLTENAIINQINGHHFIKEGLTGEEVKIGIIDGMFSGASNASSLQHLFNRHQVKAAKDFLGDKDIFEKSDNPLDRHGTAILHMIAGMDNMNHIRYGLATNSSFYLARTEHSQMERRGEEDAWVAAIEWLDSAGVRLVNSSLGYSTSFDNPIHNYSPENMDGQTSVVAQAAKIAVAQKGMVLVVSAGNEGNNGEWKIVTTPADVREVITVGATDATNLKSKVSSIGSINVSFIKPDFVCMSFGGTSLSAPVITGMIACMMQKRPDLTSETIKNIISRSCNLYPFGNNYVGYGIPDSEKILQSLVKNKRTKSGKNRILLPKRSEIILKNKKYVNNSFVVFHKSDSKTVTKQSYILSKSRQLKITQYNNAARTTVASGDITLEVIWPEK